MMSFKLKENFMSAERMSSRTMRELEILRSLPMQYVKLVMSITSISYIRSMKHTLVLKEEIRDLEIDYLKPHTKKRKYELGVQIQALMEEESLNEQIAQGLIATDKEYLFKLQDYLDYIHENSENIITEVYDLPNDFDITELSESQISEMVNDFFLLREKSTKKLTDLKE